MLLADTSSIPSRTNYVFSQGGYPIGSPDPNRSYWAIKRTDDKWVCELDTVTDFMIGKRNLDWSLDICSTGDWKHIKELWMICPPTHVAPGGNTAHFSIETPGTAFQLKVGVVDSSIGASMRRPLAQMIGKVTNEETGECDVLVFDYAAQGLVVCENGRDNDGKPTYGHWRTNVYNLGRWRPDIVGEPSVAPIGRLSFPIVGLHFGDRG